MQTLPNVRNPAGLGGARENADREWSAITNSNNKPEPVAVQANDRPGRIQCWRMGDAFPRTFENGRACQ